MTSKITGIAASDGIAQAKAYLLVEPDLTVEKNEVSDTDGEMKRLKKQRIKQKNN